MREMFTPILFSDFIERTGITKKDLIKNWDASLIVSLRQLKTIEAVQIMPFNYLKQLLTHVTLQDRPEKPYKNCEVITSRMDPCNLLIGQTFIQRDKYQAFLENFQDSFVNFCVTKGVAKCTALIAFGKTEDENPAIAHYLPPIVEENNGELCLLDGIHRNFLVKMVGTTLETIIIRKVKYAFPCDLQIWNSIKVVNEKPPKEKRFFNLRPELFRDLKIVGIDG